MCKLKKSHLYIGLIKQNVEDAKYSKFTIIKNLQANKPYSGAGSLITSDVI